MSANISPESQVILDQVLSESKRLMPDITQTTQANIASTLDRVGMRGIEMPILVMGQDNHVMTLPAKMNFFVSLDDAKAKGIHMSRLYLTGQKLLAHREFNAATMVSLLEAFIGSHMALSHSAAARVSFEYMSRRPSLLSEYDGWRFYPVVFEGQQHNGRITIDMTLSITYSSTCPCSAALSRQLIQKKFEEKFAGQANVEAEEVRHWLGQQEAMAASPHSQRSHAHVTLRFVDPKDNHLMEYWVDLLEKAIATPVQTAVKRKDEQEFARLNAENLMFCEDAARVIKKALDDRDDLADYRIEVEHLESLHAHDAVAITTKGVPDGLKP